LTGERTIRYQERRSSIRERRSAYWFDDGKGPGRWHVVRVFLLVAGAAFLGWYGRQGVNNPFAGARTVSVSGYAGGGCAVTCVMGRDTARLSAAAGAIPPPDSLPPGSPTGAVAWKTVYPFADSAAAVLLTMGKSSVMICDSAAAAPRPDAAPPQFREKLDLLIIPPASEKDALAARNRFRPRLMAVIPPCVAPPTQNIICGPVDENGGFKYNFIIRGGKLKAVE